MTFTTAELFAAIDRADSLDAVQVHHAIWLARQERGDDTPVSYDDVRAELARMSTPQK